MGQEGTGHFVKAVHNGIEYADMQMIAEVYGGMRDGFGMSALDIGAVFERWNKGPLQSYLIEISGEVAKAFDTKPNGPLLDIIVDAAGQKGPGRWTAIEAQNLAAPIPGIEAAVVARNQSSRRDERADDEALFGAAPQKISSEAFNIDQLQAGLVAGKVLSYAQGFAMIEAASDAFDWAIPLPKTARVWRQGCIIRSSMLDDMATALTEHPDRNLMRAPAFACFGTRGTFNVLWRNHESSDIKFHPDHRYDTVELNRPVFAEDRSARCSNYICAIIGFLVHTRDQNLDLLLDKLVLIRRLLRR